MKGVQAIMFVAILLTSSLGALASPTGIGKQDAVPQEWYSHWFRDADRDHIDDYLNDGSASADVFVDYSRKVSDKDLRALDGLGERPYVDPYIDVVLLSNVKHSDLSRIADLPGVVMVEKQLPLVPMLNVSVPAVRGNASTVYSNGARNLGYNGSGVTVAIFDTGVNDNTHDSLDDLDDNTATNDPKFVAGYDTTAPVFKDVNPEDTDGHGTHVAGIAIGTGGHTHEYVGLAPGAKGVDVKVLSTFGPGTASNFLDGLAWCSQNKDKYGIKVLSMSLGTNGYSDGNDSLSRTVNEAVRRDGFVVVAAMGNDGSNGVPAPAAADEVIAVGAYDDKNTITRTDDSIASFSNYGPRTSDGDQDQLDELKPDVSAPGVNIMSAWHTSPDGYISMSGTSQATPHVSGTAALMLQADPELTPQEVKAILRDTAQAKGNPYNTNLDPKYNTQYGWGMLDAYGAVKRAEDLKKGASIVGPPTLQTGGTGTITAKLRFTRTEFQSTPDNASMNITIPVKWGKPSNIAVSSAEGVTYTTGHTDPVEGASNWTFDAWAVFTGTVTSPKQLEPTVSFTTFAPGQTGSYRFGNVPSLNGVKGTAKTTDIQVTPGGTGKPDLYLTSNDITFSSDTPLPGQPVTITAVVHNAGNLGANANVTFFDGPPQTGLIIGASQVSVSAGGTDTATARWIAMPGTHTIYVVADLRNQVDELNEANNEANRSITVVGLNNPPTASLTVTPTNAGIYEAVRFDGGNSTDVDGIVVLYNYDFGDGNTSGWVAQNNVTHAYAKAGIYIATLTVQDNGGARSTNDPQVLVNVQQTTTLARTLYMAEGNHLTFSEPEGTTALKTSLPNGFTPITPGSPFGTVHSKEVGTWTSNAFSKNVTIGGEVNYHIWVNDTGVDSIDITNFTFYLMLNDVIQNKVVNAQAITMLPGQPVQIVATSSVAELKVKSGDKLALNIWCAISGNNGVLEYGTKTRDSGVDLSFTSFPGVPPVVDAGNNITARINATVSFAPTATDEDGTIIKWEWDFDGNGVWDYSSSKTGATTHQYLDAGAYNATVRVTDNDGQTSMDTVKVTVLPPNRAPVITNPSPPTSSVTVQAGNWQVFSAKITDPDGDLLTIKWTVDGKKRVESGSSFNYSTTDADVGNHEVKVSATDGTDTTAHSWAVTVSSVDHAPVIDIAEPSVKYVTMTTDETRQFEVQVTDPDGDTLTYKWTIDGATVGSKSIWQYTPDVDAAGVHAVKVTISDGTLSVTSDWTVEVISANHNPSIRSTSPDNGAKYKTTSQIPFDVDATDQDGDKLQYTWTSSRDGQLSKEKSFTITLSNGTHTITVKVEDGKGGSAQKTFTVIVEKPKKVTTNPFGDTTTIGLLALVVIVLVGVIGAYLWMGQRQRELEAERAEALRKARTAKPARPKARPRQPVKAVRPAPRPVKARPQKRPTMTEKAKAEQDELIWDLPTPPITKVDEGDHGRIMVDQKPPAGPVPRKVVRRVVKKE